MARKKRRMIKRNLIRRILAFIAGGFAVIVVAVALVSSIFYAGTHIFETLASMAQGILNGVGVAVGGMLGSLLLMRFKSARRFIKKTVEDITSKVDNGS